jgi:hypothetical protein
MVSSTQIQSAGEYVEWLRQQVHEKQVPATTRVRAAGACLALAQEHHHSIVFLVDHQLYGSAFALVRLAFEAYVRGEWLALCATDASLQSFLAGQEPPKIDNLLADLERTPAFSESVLSAIKAKSWRAMCDYTHTGGRHVQRWNTADAIEASYEDGEIREVLSFAEAIGSLSVIGLATLADDSELALRVLERVKQRAA